MHSRSPLRAALACSLSLLLGGQSLLAWTPGTGSPSAVEGFVVDPANRTDVLSFYHCIYAASQGFPANLAWTGNVAGCVPGTTGANFKDDTRRRINFYRALVAQPADITFDALKSSKDQDAALMMSSNAAVSHTPPNTWSCYTATGAEAAGASNLALGNYGPDAVNAYMVDAGGDNQVVGHRRWLLYSRGKEMGTGDIPPNGGFSSANAIWVIGNPKPAPTPQFVAWPNRGFVPLPLMPGRWSLSYPGANFGAAAVTMTQGATNVSTTIVSNVDNGFADNTLVWEPTALPTSIAADTTYNITVSGISGAGVPASYNYSVTLFDPAVLGDAVNITGTSTPPTSGATYTFNSIAQADSYELRVTTGSPAPWTEGAEDAPPPQIIPATTGTYALRQTGLKRTGAKAFQLAFPDFTDQSFEIARDLIPSATSALVFYDRGRFATTTTTLGAEISTDGGATWTSLFSRPGVGLSSGLWDAAFITRNISLSAYAGQIVRLRFILRSNGASIVVSTSVNDGFFLDDISVTNATELVSPTVTTLAANATSLTLNASTAGAPLVAGTSYFLRVRPNVGCRWFGYGPAKVTTAQALTGYALWVATQYPSVTGGPAADQELDGLPNGVEYAFGLNPTSFTSPLLLPQPIRVGSNLVTSYTQPPGVTGVTYRAEWSRDLVTWFNIPDTGSSGTHTFTVSVLNEPRAFFRHSVSVAP